MLNPDFRDILSEFCGAGIEFLLVGAYALAAHGLPRATGDIDLWVRCDPENASRILTALTRFGAPLTGVSERDFEAPGMVLQLGVSPRRIDILTAIDGVTFDEAWRDRLIVDLEGLRIPVLSRGHLIQNKLSTGRPKDAVDVSALKAQEGERP